MKRLCLSILLMSLVIKGTTQVEGQQFPRLIFTYDWRGKGLDLVGRWMLRDITLAQLKEQYEQCIPELVAAWEKEAPALFTELIFSFGKGFSQSERTVILYLSGNSSYGSARFLVIGLRYIIDPKPWVASFSREENFTATVFHELLHVWVDEHIDAKKSPLLQKYQKEHVDTREHIHLMALQRMVYQKLKRQNMLEMLDYGYRNLCSPEYRRAWQIVVDLEGDKAVLEDIQVSLDRFSP